jgi:DNA helicase II / ATP-dependent DNA helicase PcrA
MSSYLQALNPEQRAAVEHGVVANGANIAGPLLVIAGAGSGKTNTLAHRVAHLIVNGADPGRILLLTFSRRAAAEMERRVERIITAALGPTGARARIGWSGTFHAVGARLLRSHAHAIGLDPSFTIHDTASGQRPLARSSIASPVALRPMRLPPSRRRPRPRRVGATLSR